ncbi:mucin-19-like [Dermacentor silvarum]|uniref:mucin-19-like n=1 Tax=Dermacentor silvarum TaxID=543639 RepID=UPI00210186DE|nr:mucin-19-like [Dermacentor silvarum]
MHEVPLLVAQEHIHLEASPGSGNTRTVGVLEHLPGLSKSPQYAEKTGAYGSFTGTSLPSGFSISSTGAPIGVGSDVFRSSEHLGRFAGSPIVEAGGNPEQPLGSRDSREHAGGSPTGSGKTQFENSGQYGPHVLEAQPSRFTIGTSESPVASLASVHLDAYPSSGNTRPVGALVNGPGLSKSPQSAEKIGAYGSFADTSLPSGFSISSTGAPIGVGSDVFRSSEHLGRLAGSPIVEAGGNPGQPLGSRDSREHAGGSPAGSAKAQFENSGQYGPHVLEAQPSRFTIGTSESPVASLASVHLDASPSSGNTRPVGALANGPGLSEATSIC